MKNPVEVMAAAIAHKPHSFDFIRNATGLKLTDAQFSAMVKDNVGRFKLVRFLKRDGAGAPIRPGRIGVKLRANGSA
jgi:hypothetical protein